MRGAALKVGDRVRFQFGTSRWVGRVVEDLGPLGRGGRQIVRVVAPIDPTGEMSFELPAEAFTLVKPRARAAPSRSTARRLKTA
jgi:hypothetical protein